MNAFTSEPNQLNSLKEINLNIIDAKIQYADFKLNTFVKNIKKIGQTPSQAPGNNAVAFHSHNDVFDTIENSSLLTTKLLYLRANVSDAKNEKILDLLTNDGLETMSLDQIKEII